MCKKGDWRVEQKFMFTVIWTFLALNIQDSLFPLNCVGSAVPPGKSFGLEPKGNERENEKEDR